MLHIYSYRASAILVLACYSDPAISDETSTFDNVETSSMVLPLLYLCVG